MREGIVFHAAVLKTAHRIYKSCRWQQFMPVDAYQAAAAKLCILKLRVLGGMQTSHCAVIKAAAGK